MDVCDGASRSPGWLGGGSSSQEIDEQDSCALDIEAPHAEATMSDPLIVEREIAAVLNKYSLENGSNTPDFLLAQYLLGCLAIYNSTVSAREAWYGRRLTSHPSGEAPAPMEHP